jgi:hypothetical protein
MARNNESAPQTTDGLVMHWLSDSQLTIWHDGAYLNAPYDADTGSMYMTDMFVPSENRRQGIGRSLVRAAHGVLLERGGLHMAGDISTRPSADAIRSVLGHEAVISIVEGEYVPDDPDYVPPAVARVDYHVPQPDATGDSTVELPGAMDAATTEQLTTVG